MLTQDDAFFNAPAQVFRPTMTEFQSLEQYVISIEEPLRRFGIVKVTTCFRGTGTYTSCAHLLCVLLCPDVAVLILLL